MNSSRCLLLPLFVPLVCVAFCGVSKGETILLTPDSNWFEMLGSGDANPGDQFVLAEGVYTDSRRLVVNQHGTKERPIVIRADGGASVVFRRPDARQNSINLLGCQYLVLRGIEITGGSSGIRIGAADGRSAKHITLEDLHIHHVGGVAVTANFSGESYESLIFRRNHIHHTGGHGEAFYLGSNNAADGSTTGRLFNSIVERNYIHDLQGPTVTQGDGIELKDGSYGNIVRDNVIHDTKYPGITVYGTDGKEANIIERNVIWNSGDNGIQAAADAIIRNNIVFKTKGAGIYCRNHQSAIVGRLRIVNNTVLSDDSIRIISPEFFSGNVIVANNAFAGQVRLGESPGMIVQANAHGINEPFPSDGSPCVGSADPKFVPLDDFNGSGRGRSYDVGAYKADSAGNPGWKIVPGFKSIN